MIDIAQLVGVKPNLFPSNSRYYGIATATLEEIDGDGNPRVVVCLRRRFVSPQERL